MSRIIEFRNWTKKHSRTWETYQDAAYEWAKAFMLEVTGGKIKTVNLDYDSLDDDGEPKYDEGFYVSPEGQAIYRVYDRESECVKYYYLANIDQLRKNPNFRTMIQRGVESYLEREWPQCFRETFLGQRSL